LLGTVLSLIILILLSGDAWVFTPLVHLRGLIVVNVESKKFLPQIQTFATIFDTFVVLVDLEQEKHVIFINFPIRVIFLQKLCDSFLYFLFFLQKFRCQRCINPLSLQRLVLVEVAFKQSVMQVYIGQLPLLEVNFVTEGRNEKFKEFP